MIKNVARIALFGIALGLFTSFGQTYLPDPFTQLANSYSVWLLFAFACGILVSSYRWAAVGGAVVQYLALASYYVLLHLRFDGAGFNSSSNIIWLVGGTLAGPVAGVCGKIYANRAKHSHYALSFIGAVALSEALYNFVQLRYVGEGMVFLVLAAGLVTALLWKYENRARTLLPLVVFTVLAYVGYAFVLMKIFG
jgi:hypothetical protein